MKGTFAARRGDGLVFVCVEHGTPLGGMSQLLGIGAGLDCRSVRNNAPGLSNEPMPYRRRYHTQGLFGFSRTTRFSIDFTSSAATTYQ